MKKYILNKEERSALFSLSHFIKIGPQKMKLLFFHFKSYQKILSASAKQLENLGIKNDLINEFVSWRKSFNLETAEKIIKEENIGFITWHDKNYPFLLKEIYSPPYVLFFKGNLELIKENNLNNCLAVVGPRKNSPLADKTINHLLPKIVKSNLTIVSGLALGVDKMAHEIAISLKGKTIAILGTGLAEKVFYPKENLSLYQEIIKSNNLIISEFPPLISARAQNFPQRNRLISGLSKATLVIEAPKRSGALITTSRALEQNREVLAVPGNIFSEFYVGSNNLIKLGAKVITNPDDILEIYEK
jgi:DNA processing protein